MLRSGLDGLRPGLLTSCLRKANRRRKRILTYRRLLSAAAQSALKTFCRSSDMRRFFWKATEDEKTGRIRTSLALPYREALVNKPAMNRQAAAKPSHIEQKFGEEGGWALAMALDASRIEARSKNRSENTACFITLL